MSRSTWKVVGGVVLGAALAVVYFLFIRKPKTEEEVADKKFAVK